MKAEIHPKLISVYKVSKRPTVVDLFSGCGGMSLGFEAAGFDIAASIEFDAIHSIVHHFNFPYTATICRDIGAVKVNEVLDLLSEKKYQREIDVIVGGPPCQGFSHIGKRALDDPRNSLVFEYLRLVKELRPKYFVFENVPGIASGKHLSFLNELINEFKKIKYSVLLPYKVLDSSFYGVPQKRRRLILVGYRNDVSTPEYPNPVCNSEDSLNNDLFSQTRFFVGSSNAISDLESYEVFTGKDQGIDAKNKAYTEFQKNYSFKPNGVFKLCHTRSVDEIIWGHIGSKHNQESRDRFSETIPGKTEQKSRFFKLHPSQPCHTIRAGTASDRGAYTAPRPIHYQQPRCITVREAARLHGFPDWFQFHKTIWHGFREIGNAVSPIFAKHIADEIIKCLGINKKDMRTYKLMKMNESILEYNMTQASEYWGVADDVIPKRKRLN